MPWKSKVLQHECPIAASGLLLCAPASPEWPPACAAPSACHRKQQMQGNKVSTTYAFFLRGVLIPAVVRAQAWTMSPT